MFNAYLPLAKVDTNYYNDIYTGTKIYIKYYLCYNVCMYVCKNQVLLSFKYIPKEMYAAVNHTICHLLIAFTLRWVERLTAC